MDNGRRRLRTLNLRLELPTPNGDPWLLFLYLGRAVPGTLRPVKALTAFLGKNKEIVVPPAQFLDALSEQVLRRHGREAIEPPSITVTDVELAMASFGRVDAPAGRRTARGQAARAGKRVRGVDENEEEEEADDNHGEGPSTRRSSTKRRKTTSMPEQGRTRGSGGSLSHLDISSTFVMSPSTLNNLNLDFGDTTIPAEETAGFEESLDRMKEMMEHCRGLVGRFAGDDFVAQQARFAHQAVAAMTENAIRTTEEYLRARQNGGEEQGEEEEGAEAGEGEEDEA